MSLNPRSPLVLIVLAFLVVAGVRELSIRRHLDDLHDWPTAT